MADGGGIKKAKCVNKNVVDDIGHKEYVDVLFGWGLMRHNMKKNCIEKKLHTIGIYKVCKIFLSCFHDKR